MSLLFRFSLARSLCRPECTRAYMTNLVCLKGERGVGRGGAKQALSVVSWRHVEWSSHCSSSIKYLFCMDLDSMFFDLLESVSLCVRWDLCCCRL